jgi:hypothetical protein
MTYPIELGRRVLYSLTEQDAAAISSQRQAYIQRNEPGDKALQVHQGNVVKAGQFFPADIVAVFGGSANLQVHLDGTDSYWATSRAQGMGPGMWHYPPRA